MKGVTRQEAGDIVKEAAVQKKRLPYRAALLVSILLVISAFYLTPAPV